MQFTVADMAGDVGFVTLEDDSGVITVLVQVPIEAVDRGIEGAVLKPADIHLAAFKGGVLDRRVRAHPVDALAVLAPEAFGILNGLPVHRLVLRLVHEGMFHGILDGIDAVCSHGVSPSVG